MNYDVAGPFEVKDSKPELKADMENYKAGLASAIGCYLFVLKAGRGYTPYYAGRTHKQSLIEECMNASNLAKYNQALDDKQGTPIFFFLPMMTPAGRFRKKPLGNSRFGSLGFLETWMIAEALQKNRELLNIQSTRYLRKLNVTGVFNPTRGEATQASQELRKALS